MIAQIVNETKNAVLATIKGADDVLSALRGAVKNQLTGVATDVSNMAVSVVEEAVASASGLGVSTADATAAAVKGAIKAARTVGQETVGTVSGALQSVASIPREVLEAALKGDD